MLQMIMNIFKHTILQFVSHNECFTALSSIVVLEFITQIAEEIDMVV